MQQTSNCVFCQIVQGDLDASVAYADDVAIAIMDLRPANPGHTLVVPREHARGLEDLDEATGTHLWRVAQRIGRGLRDCGLRCEGVNLLLADGEPAGQEVFHIHLHVIPRYPGDGFRIAADWGSPDQADLEHTAEAVRAGLEGLIDEAG